MTIVWTYELITVTTVLLLFLVIFSTWSNKFFRSICLIIGLFGLWLSMADPTYELTKYKRATEVANIPEFLISKQAGETDTVLISGFDHHLEDLDLLDSFHVKVDSQFYIQPGLFDIHYNDRVIASEKVSINGKVYGVSDDTFNVILESPDGEQIKPKFGSTELFQFSVEAPVAGLYEYKMMLIQNLDTVVELLPLQVLPARQLTMLIYTNRPGFEYNYLKNYWVEEGHGIIQKVRVSKDRFNSTYINAPSLSFDRLTESVLHDLDVILMDVEMWNSINTEERRVVLSAIDNYGLGLILSPGIEGARARDLPFNELADISAEDIDNVDLQRLTYSLANEWKTFDSGFSFGKGYGKVVLLKWGSTYRLILADKAKLYQNIWSEVFSEAYVQFQEGFVAESSFPTFAQDEVELKLYQTMQDDSIFLLDQKLSLMNLPLLTGVAYAHVEPQMGWNKLTRSTDRAEDWFYAFDTSAWKTWQQLKVKDRLLQLSSQEGKTISDVYMLRKTLPWWLGYMLFLIGFGLIWVLEKLT
ncbi:hypothetical protein [Portibacter marinus]|uniref:hypothetical protein n=1 Tax=Portibacter marinus TaxID=2898660 RepID=UPI001F230470|nr:hypothetical protein [Portibacter marinus]